MAGLAFAVGNCFPVIAFVIGDSSRSFSLLRVVSDGLSLAGSFWTAGGKDIEPYGPMGIRGFFVVALLLLWHGESSCIVQTVRCRLAGSDTACR